MGMSIRTNRGGNTSCRNLKKTSKKGDKNLEKLSSGYQINRAGDDASGLAITEKMRAQITALEKYSENSEDGISLIQTAEGYLGEVHDMLDRMYELCIRAGDGIFEENERGMIQEEVNQLNDEIDRISDTANFNGNKLFDANYKWVTTKEIHDVVYYDTVEEIVQETVDVVYTSGLPDWLGLDPASASTGAMSSKYTGTVPSIKYSSISHSYENTDLDGTFRAAYLDFSNFKPSDIASSVGKGFYTTCCYCANHYSIKFVDEPLDDPNNYTPTPREVSGHHFVYKVNLNGCKNGNEVIDRILATTGDVFENRSGKRHYTSLIKDGDKLVITDNQTPEYKSYLQKGSGLIGGGIATESKTTEKTETRIIKRVEQEEVEIKNLVHSDRVIAINAGERKVGKIYIGLPEMSASTLNTRMVNVMDMDSAGASTEIVKNAINTISMERAQLGAQQNRLEYTIDDLNTTHENMSAAKSRIKDADISKEMMGYTQNNVLMQSAQSMLAQANTQPQSVLQLLQ